MGYWSLHETSNENGIRAIDFATNNTMIIKKTNFPHKNIQETWKPPDRRTNNQIDHVLVDRRPASSIMNVRSCRVADCYLDHHLVQIKHR